MEVCGFPHQVGGHFGLLSIPGHVCKPLNQREYEFYTQMSPRLQPFAAKLCNRIKIQCCGQADGSLMMSTETLVDCHQQSIQTGGQQQAIVKSSTGSANSSTSTLSTCSSTSIISSTGSYSSRERRQQASMAFRVKNGRVETAEKSMGNLWAGQCQSKVVQKLLKGHDRAFILLEDLVAGYGRPCVIDLKMGTRQYGDDASAQKRITQTQKCRHSTSSIFGVRLVGMQLYEPENEEYMFVNKYEGRRMDRAQFHDSLLQFFKLAGKHRTRRLIDELLSLRKLLVQSDGFRFFSSSLLIAYDGEECATRGAQSPQNGEITIKMIDFAHSTFSGFLEDAPYTGIDEGYLLGIDSLINFLSAFLQSGFKPMGTASSDQQKRPPLKRKLENGDGGPEKGTGSTTAMMMDAELDEESSLNSSVGFTSGDSGTEMGEQEEDNATEQGADGLGAGGEEETAGIQVNIPQSRADMEKGNTTKHVIST